MTDFSLYVLDSVLVNISKMVSDAFGGVEWGYRYYGARYQCMSSNSDKFSPSVRVDVVGSIVEASLTEIAEREPNGNDR